MELLVVFVGHHGAIAIGMQRAVRVEGSRYRRSTRGVRRVVGCRPRHRAGSWLRRGCFYAPGSPAVVVSAAARSCSVVFSSRSPTAAARSTAGTRLLLPEGRRVESDSGSCRYNGPLECALNNVTQAASRMRAGPEVEGQLLRTHARNSTAPSRPARRARRPPRRAGARRPGPPRPARPTAT